MIFVTGGTGFIGAHLLMHLADKGNNVRALKRSTSSLQFFIDLLEFYNKSSLSKQIEWVEGDIDDTQTLCELLQGCDTVYHCAGKVSFSEKEWDSLLAINRNGTANVVNAALEAGVDKFCLFSSVAALDMSQGIKGKKTDWKVFRKEQPYGYSKYLGELEAFRGYEEGLKVLVLNPAVVMGASEKTNPLNKFLGRLERGLKYYPTGSTGFVSANELCELAISCTEKLEEKLQVTVCSKNMTFKESIGMICEAGNFTTPRSPLSGLVYFSAMASARFLKFFGMRSGLSVSGLRAITNLGSYPTDDLNTYHATGQTVEEAVKDAVRFYKK